MRVLVLICLLNIAITEAIASTGSNNNNNNDNSGATGKTDTIKFDLSSLNSITDFFTGNLLWFIVGLGTLGGLILLCYLFCCVHCLIQDCCPPKRYIRVHEDEVDFDEKAPPAYVGGRAGFVRLRVNES